MSDSQSGLTSPRFVTFGPTGTAPIDCDVAVIGCGSAAEALLRELDGHGLRTVVFEPDLVGGECPFFACMPSKSMLHDRAAGRDWSAAVDRRHDVVDHLDDSEHVESAEALGAELVRSSARVVGPHTVVAGGIRYGADHVVVATGADAVVPDIPGLDMTHPRVWTSSDALTTTEAPESVVVLGGGVIGGELASMFAGFGVDATTLDQSDRPMGDLHPRVSALVDSTLSDAGVEVVNGISVKSVVLEDDSATVVLEDGDEHRADRLIVSVGRRPAQQCIDLDALGLSDVVVENSGRLAGTDSVWLLGDAAGLDQYTHVANHHAAVVADHLVGSGTRRYDDVVVPACVFTDPPVIVVGSSWTELADDDDVVWAEVDFDVPRRTTDELGPGFLAVAARRSTGCVVAANGIGARFDEIVHALVVAIDGRVPISRLAQSMQPFPTVGEILGQGFTSLNEQLS